MTSTSTGPGHDPAPGPLRVLLVGPLPPPLHGVSAFVRDLAERGLGRGVVLAHLDTSDHRDTRNIGRWDARNVALGLHHLAELIQRAQRWRPHVVYLPISQNVPAFLRDGLFIWAAAACGARVAAHLHGGYFRELYERHANGLFGRFVRLTMRRVHAMAVSGDVFRALFRGLLPGERIHVVPNGVPDPGAWALRAQKRPLRARPDPKGGALLYLSTLTRTKGLLELLEACALLAPKRPRLRLAVAGTWSGGEEGLQREAEALIAREGLGNRVRFLGNVEGRAKAEALAGADLFCLPTRYPFEAQPLSIIEALAAGLPVLSTRHAAIAETVDEGRSGVLLRKDAPPAELASGIEALLSDPERLAVMGAAARQRYLERFTLEQGHARLRAFFRACMET